MLTPSRQVSPNTIGSVKTPRIWFLKTPLLGLFLTLSFTTAFAGNIWDGGGGDNLWGTGANWDGDTSPGTGTTQDLNFAGTTRLTPQNNYGNWDDFRSIFFNSGAGAFTINGNPVDLWVASGSGKIENNSSNNQTINFDSFSINGGNYEMNPVSGNLSVTSNNIFTNGNQIHVWGDKTLSFGASTVISQGGGLVVQGGGTVIFQSAHTYTGQSYINSGTLRINPGGSANSSTLNLGDTSGSSNATLLLGGNNMSLSSAVNVRSGNTGSMTINASGSNLTLSGGITLNRNAAITAGAGNDLTISGAINTNGNTLDKLGAGNLTLTSTSNDANNRYYLGAGTLNVSAQTNLGNRATFGNKLYFDGGILNATANLTIQGNNGITFAGSGGRISVASGQTLTIQSYIDDINATNDFIKSGTGTLFLDKTDTNDFSHTTIRVYEGTLSTWNPGGLLSSTVQLGDTATSGTYQFTKSDGAATADKTFSIAAGGGSINVTNDALTLGTGNLTGSGTFTKLGAGTLTVSGASNSHSGAVVVSAGSLALTSAVSSSGFTLSGGNLSTSATNQLANTATLTVNTGTFTLGGADTVGDISGSGGTINLGANALTTDTASSSSYSGTITGTGGSLTKNGTGTLTLSGANTFSGGVTLNAGQLNINSATAIGSGTLRISGGTIDNTSAASITLSNNNAQSWNGNFTFAGTKDLNMGTGTITLGANRTVTVASGNLTLGAATISGNYFITKDGNGTLDIGNVSRAWSPAGGFFINSGTLAMTAGNNLGTNPSANQLIFTGNSTLRLNANSTIAAGRGMAINSGVNASVDVSTAGNTFQLQNVISGSGSLTKIGSGNLTLEAANTYTGSTTISAGTLFAVGGSAIANTSAVSVSTGAMFTLNASETVGSIAGAGNITLGANTLTAGGDNSSTTFSGIASGAGGALTKSGTGTLTLSGANTYSGATTVNAGTLSVSSVANGGSNSNIGASTAAAGNLVLGGGTLEYTGSTASTNRSFTLTAATTSAISVSNAATSLTISGAGAATTGALTKAGAGTLILSGANTYTGATTINAGTLQIGAGGTSGNLSASSAITNNANLAFNRTDTLTQGTDFASVISGTGNLIQAGTGNLILSGANTYSGSTTINAGTLTIGGSGTLGSANYTQTISNNGTFLFASSAAQILFGAITGTGNLTKTGAGAMTLNGTTANTYSGLTTITNGITYLGKTDGVNAISGNISLGDGSGGDIIYLLSGNQIADTSILTMTGTAANARGDFRLNGFSETIGGLSGDGLVQIDGGSATGKNSTITINVSSGATYSSNATIRNAGDGTGVLSFVKTGGGKQVMVNSANIYTGSTTINGGTLSVSTLANGGSQSNIGQSTNAATNLVLGGGTLEYTGSTISIDRNFTLSNGTTSAISVTNSANTLTITGAAAAGNGSLTKEGSGTLTLSGANAYTGTTTVSAGTLTVSGGTAISDSSAVSIASGAVFNLSSSETVGSIGGAGNITLGANTLTAGGDNTGTTFSGIASGSNGALTKAGSGTLVLTGANTYTGATTITGGTLQIGNAGTTGSLSGSSAISNNGTLAFNRTNTTTQGTDFASVVSGTGNLTQAGSGTVVLTGANTYSGATTITAGTLQIGNAGTTGSLSTSSSISNNGTLAFNRTNTTTQGTDFASVISGTGNLTQAGSGTLALGGTNTYSGATTINAGTINLTGSIANSATTINNGGTLLGSGTTGGLTIASGGRISPGASGAIGNINVSTLTIGGGSGYTFHIDNVTGTPGTNWDLITVGGGTGAATLNNTAASPFTVYLTGTPTGWSSAGNYNWNIIDWGTATGFSAGNFSVDTSALNVSVNGNWTFSNTGGFLNLAYAGVAISASTWSGGSGNWSSGFDTAPVNGYTLDFTGTSTATATNNISSATFNSVDKILFQSGAGAFTLAANSGSSGFNAASALAVTGTIQNLSTNTQTINLALSLATAGNEIKATNGAIVIGGAIANTANFTVSGTNNVSLNGNITGTGGITMSGSGLLSLNGTNTYSGSTTISAGTLAANGGSALGDSSAVTIGASGNLTLGAGETIGSLAGSGALSLGSNTLTTGGDNASTAFSGAATGSGGITKAGSGTFTLNGTNTYTGATTVSAGTLTISGGSAVADTSAVSISSGAVLNVGASETVGSISGAGNITLGSNALTAGGDNSSTALSGVISGVGGSLTKNGSGALTLSGANTFSGGATLNSGTLNINNASALGNGTFTVNGGSINNTSGSAITASNNQTWNSGFTFAGTNDLTLSGPITLAANNTITVSGGNLALGQIYGTNKSITKNGSGTLSIAGTNRIGNWVGGSITLNSGTLQIDAGNNFGTNPSATQLTFGGNSTLSLANGFVSSIAGGRNIVINNNVAATIEALGTVTNTFAMQSVVSGGGSLVKTGAGTLIIEAANTYSGSTTINAGTLQIGQSNAVGSLSSSSSITNNGTLYFNRSDDVAQGTNFGSVISGTGDLLKGSTGNLTLTGNNTYTGSTTISGGSLRVTGSGQLGGGTYGGNIVITNVGNYLTFNSSSSQTLSGVVSGAGELQKLSSSTLTLSGNNAFTGDLRFDGGTVLIGHANATGSAASGAIVVNFADNTAKTIAASGSASYTIGRTMNIYNDLTIGQASVNTGSLNFSGAIALGTDTGNRTLTIAAGNTHTFSGAVSGNRGIVKEGTGTLTISGANTYSGGTTLNSGTLVLGNAAGLGTGAFTQSSGSSQLTIDTTGTISNALSIYNIRASQSATLGGSITVNNAVWDIDSGDTLTVSGGVSGTGGVTKNGTGTLVLSGSNSYSGATTINAGTLAAAAANALGATSSIAVNAGGSLLVSANGSVADSTPISLGSGTAAGGLAFSGNVGEVLGTLTLTSNSVIDMGSGSAWASFEGLTTLLTSTTQLQVWNYTPGSDAIYFRSSANVDGSLNFISFYSGAGTGTFYGFANSSSFSPPELHPTPVPEPETYATAVLLLLGGAIWTWRRRAISKNTLGPSCGNA